MRRLAAAVIAVLAVIIADESEPNLAHTDVKLDPDPSFPTLTLRLLPAAGKPLRHSSPPSQRERERGPWRWRPRR